MSHLSIISIILIVIGIAVISFVMLNGLNIDLENPEHIAGAMGMIAPGMFIAIIAGLVIALVVHLFSKGRSRAKFFLVFSIVFMLTTLVMAFGVSENRKIQQTNLNASNAGALTTPYISSEHGFRVNFPTEPKHGTGSYVPYGIEGEATVYISTKQFASGEVIYYVIVNDMKALAFVDDNSRKNYYEQFPTLGLADAGQKLLKYTLMLKMFMMTKRELNTHID